MPEEKRTFETQAHLLQSPSLQARRLKGKEGAPELAPGCDLEKPLECGPQPVTQDLILRLIKLLKES
jgi:hypothetical protein